MLLRQKRRQPDRDTPVDRRREVEPDDERRERPSITADVSEQRRDRLAATCVVLWWRLPEGHHKQRDGEPWQADEEKHRLPRADRADHGQRPHRLRGCKADDPAADEVRESRPDENAGRIDAHRGTEALTREEIGDQRRAWRLERRFADTDSNSRTEQSPKAAGDAAQRCHYTPERDTRRDDVSAAPAVRQSGDRQTKQRIEDRERKADENSCLCHRESQIATHRLDEQRHDQPIDEPGQIGEHEQPYDVPRPHRLIHFERRRAVIRTATSSGRGLMKSSRVRPSGSSPIVEGIELLVNIQPLGKTTALNGLPNARSHTSSSPTTLYRAVSVYVSNIRRRTLSPCFGGVKRNTTTSESPR